MRDHSSNHPVTMHCMGRVLRRNKQVASHIFRTLIGNDESITIFMHLETAYEELTAKTRDDILSTAKLNELSAFGETVERFLDLPARVPFRAELANEIFEGGSSMRSTTQVTEQRII